MSSQYSHAPSELNEFLSVAWKKKNTMVKKNRKHQTKITMTAMVWFPSNQANLPSHRRADLIINLKEIARSQKQYKFTSITYHMEKFAEAKKVCLNSDWCISENQPEQEISPEWAALRFRERRGGSRRSQEWRPCSLLQSGSSAATLSQVRLSGSEFPSSVEPPLEMKFSQIFPRNASGCGWKMKLRVRDHEGRFRHRIQPALVCLFLRFFTSPVEMQGTKDKN